MKYATRILVCVIAVIARIFIESSSTFYIFSTTTHGIRRRRVNVFSTLVGV